MDVSVEDNFPAGCRRRPARARHKIVTVDDYNQFGSGQMIWKMDGGWLAASDPRRDGQAAGY
jgi:gamma-glutamyltranspeptidase/glutathione hydrolase